MKTVASPTPNPRKVRAQPRRRREPVADRNQRWYRMTIEGTTSLQIADREAFSLRTVQLGIAKAKASHEPEATDDDTLLSADDLGYLTRRSRSDSSWKTAEVRDFIETQRARRRA